MSQDCIVSAIIIKDGKFLLAKRASHKKIAPGMYHLPGGHVEFGEDPEQAIVREIMEELSLAVTVISIERTFSYTQDDLHTIGITYVVEANDLNSLTYDPDDNEEVVWVDLATAEQLYSQFPNPSNHDLTTLRNYFSRL